MIAPYPNPAVSVLLPTFNGSAFIIRQIRSILDQKLSRLELIVRDDGSTDGTVELARAAVAGDDRVRFVEGEGNIGQRAGLIALLDRAHAPLIAFADQDDIWDDMKLMRLSVRLGERSMAFGSSRLIDQNDRDLGATIAGHTGSPPADGDRLAYLFRPYVSAHAALIRRDALSPYAFTRAAHFDWLVSLDAAFRDGIVYVPDAIVWHRIHANNQANAALGAAANRISTLRPSAIYGRLHRKGARRFTFLAALEHLAFSPVLGPAARQDFAKALALCRGAWFDPGISRPFVNTKLRRAIMALLSPYAGSSYDLEMAHRRVGGLT